MDASEINKQIVTTATALVSEKTNIQDSKKLHFELLKLVSQALVLLEITMKKFKKMKEEKKKRSGGFLKGYVLSEKVLPIGKGAARHKLIRDDKMDTATGAQRTIAKTSPIGIRPIPEKLVRDKIPTIIENQARKNWEKVCKKTSDNEDISINEAKKRTSPLKGYKAKIRIASKQELIILLRKKLREETIEFLAHKDKEDVLEDLGDILEVVDAYRFHLQDD